jgi:PPP family 3-phenylpropionic acid transporter
MKNSLQAISLPALLRRWRSLDNRDLWGLLAALFALYLLLLSLLTQPPDEMLNLLLVMGGALMVLHQPPAGWQPRPGRIGRWVGVALLVAMLWFGQRLMNSDFISSLLPLLAGIALALLVMVALVAFNMREEATIPRSHDTPSVRQLLKQREVIAFFVSTFLMIAAHASLYVYYSLYLSEIGYSKTVIGLMWSLGVVAEILFFYFQAPLFRRYGVATLMLTSLVVGVVRFLMIGFGADSLLLLLIAQILHAATFGVHHSASVATLQRWFAGPLQARGQALFISVSYGLGGSVGGLLLSACWDTFGARFVYIIAALLCLAGWFAAALSYRWQEQLGNR